MADGINRKKFIAESAKHLAETETGNLLAFLADECKRYKAEIMPMYPTDEMDDCQEFDWAKSEFLDDLWDTIYQHFTDEKNGV